MDAELWGGVPRPRSRVLDDVHALPQDSPRARLLGHLVTGLPSKAHVVLADYPPPPVPTARLAASGQLIELGEADLLFDEEELRAFAAKRAVLLAVVAHSGGWPALAELAAAAVFRWYWASPGGGALHPLWEPALAGRLSEGDRGSVDVLRP